MRRPLSTAALALAVLLAPAASLGAQAAPVDSGARVRIVSPTIRGVYRVVASSADTLVLQYAPASPLRHVPVAAIERLDVDRPRPAGARIGRGLMIGAGIGAGIGVIVGLAAGDDPDGWSSAGDNAAVLGFLGGVVGGVAGALVGGLGSGERWVPVELGRMTLVAPPVGRGVGLRVAGAF